MSRERNERLAAAIAYATKLRWPVLAVHGVKSDGRCTCGKSDCEHPGKHPCWHKRWLPHGVKNATTDQELIRRWWQIWPWANVAIATGGISGVDVLDVDVAPDVDGNDTLGDLTGHHGELPDTVEQMTGGGGRQLFFRYTGRIKGRARFAEGLDTRSDGNYVIVPPSRHASGRGYVWEVSSRPGKLALAEMPEWLIRVINGNNGHRAHIAAGERVDPKKVLHGVPAGERDVTLYRYACSLRARNIDYDEAVYLVCVAAANCEPPFPEKEAVAKVKSAWRHEPGTKKPRRAERPVADPHADSHTGDGGGFLYLTDLGNAERLVKKFGGDIRYCANWKSWMVWDGRLWAQDHKEKIVDLASRTVRSIYAEAEAMPDKDMRARIVKHAVRSESRRAIESMIRLARPKVAVLADTFDTDPWLLNCRNGVLDLRTARLHPHDRDLFISKCVPADYNPDAAYDLWLQFLHQIMDGDEALISFLQRAVGYSLTGDVSEQCLFLLYGTGANGKSTFLETLRDVLGDGYAQQTGFETFLMKNYEKAASNDIARLAGTRFVSALEAEAGRRFSEVTIKQLTGGDKIAARFLFQEYFEFEPTFKIWLATNHKPIIRGQDEAIWRRIKLIPFTVQIPVRDRDPKLRHKLKSEAEGILRWAVEGGLAWQAEGLSAPNIVRSATEEYREEMDVLGEFLSERCLIDQRCSQRASEIYQAYTEWAESNGERPISQRAFGLRMAEREFKKTKLHGRVMYQGVGLVSGY